MINADDIVKLAYLLDPSFQLVNTEGKPITGGYLEVYLHGTRTKYYCYSDWAGALHPFRIPLDSLGANIVLASPVHSYDIYVYNKYGALVLSRYNVIPATGEGTFIGDIVTIDSPDNTVEVTVDSGTAWHVSVKDTIDSVTATIANDLDGKKDLQEDKEYNGSVTKTITKVEQDEQGIITVTYEDIALPQEVPNIEISSPNGTIDIQSSVDEETNTKTFSIDIAKDNLQSFIGHYGKGRSEDRDPGSSSGFGLYVDDWVNYSYDGNFITNNWQTNNNQLISLVPGLYMVHAVIKYDMSSDSTSNTDHYMKVFTGYRNGLESGTRYKDWTHESNLEDNTIEVNFIRKVTSEANNTIEISPEFPYGVTSAHLQEFQLVKLDSIVGSAGECPPVIPGLDKVYHDDSLLGDGTQESPLSVAQVASNLVIGREENNILADNYDGIKIKKASTDNEVIGLKKGSSWTDYGMLSPVTQSANKILITDVNGKQQWGEVGKGLEIDDDTLSVNIDRDVSDVVETVQKLKEDLDSQITPNFDIPNISKVFDFADGDNWMSHNGACMLYQAFTIPINRDLRTLTDDKVHPTLLGIYAQQGFGNKIMLALYEYTYAKAGEENGSSTYVGDTGPVNVVQGVNEFPLKNRNPSITELRSDKVYYASLYLPSNAFGSGLILAGCPSYGEQSVPAQPRLTCATENITVNSQELDMDDPTTTLNHYTTYTLPDGKEYYQYDIGPWSGGYNERWSTPRFYLQIRNGEPKEIIIPTAPFTDLGESKLPDQFDLVTNLPAPEGWSWDADGLSFVDVKPMADVTITEYEYIDTLEIAPGYVSQHCVYNSDYSTHLGGTATVTDLGQAVSITNAGTTVIGYRHKVVFSSPITLTADTTYRFLAECWNNVATYVLAWSTPTNVVDVGNNGWYVDYAQNIVRYPNYVGKYLRLTDSNNNHYVI